MVYEVETRLLEHSDTNNKVYESTLCVPKGAPGKRPAVLVHHAFGGVSDFEISRAQELAKLGYVALAADVYGKGTRGGKSIPDNLAILKPLIQTRTTELKVRLLSALEAIKSVENVDTNKIAAIGYCFGGLCALDQARHQTGILAAVSYHGTLTPLEGSPLEHFNTTIQVHNGDADTHVTKEVIDGFFEEMRARKVDWSYVAHGNAVHGFTEPHAGDFGVPTLAYNKEADHRSWSATLSLLAEKFGDH